MLWRITLMHRCR